MDQGRKLKQAVSSTASALLKEATGDGGEKGGEGIVDLKLIEELIASWPTVPRNVAKRTIEKYGAPAEATPSRLIWSTMAPGFVPFFTATRCLTIFRNHTRMYSSSSSPITCRSRNSTR
jgi:hypothetical protein